MATYGKTVDGTSEAGAAEPGVPEAAGDGGGLLRLLGASLRFVLVIALLGAGAAAAAYFLTTKPKAERRPPGDTAELVTVEPIRVGPQSVTVYAMGTVAPARRVVLSPQVTGDIVTVSDALIPGGRFAAGENLVQIDPADYNIAVEQGDIAVRQARAELDRRTSEAAQRATDVIKAECSLQIEKGQQAIARSEYELLGKTLEETDAALVLRRPQLRAAQAALDAARAAEKGAQAYKQAAQAAVDAATAALRQARLDLARTAIAAPFNALLISKSVELGTHVTPAVPIATLVGTDEYWVEASVPVDELKWLRLPRASGEPGSPARVYDEAAWGKGAFREGRALRLAAELEPRGRMARLLIAVDDPLCLEAAHADKPAMLIGSFVQVELVGRAMDAAALVPRTALRDGDRVWIMTPEDALEIRRIDVARRGRDAVYVREGLRDGERLVTSDLATPVDGMKLRVPEDGGAATQAATAPAAGPATDRDGTGAARRRREGRP